MKTVPCVPVPPCAVVPSSLPNPSITTPPIGVRPSGRDVKVWSTVSVCACVDTTAANRAASSTPIRRRQNEERINGFMDNPFVFPAWLDFWNCGSGRDKEPSGEKVLGLIQIRLATLILEESRLLVKLDRCDFEPLRPVPKTQSEFHLRPQQSVFRRRSVHQQRNASRSLTRFD